jgi:hypothetical protein
MNKKIPETRRYDLRTEGERSRWLGTFLVTHDGLVACNTDYGSYSYWWTSTGCDDIREFLVKIDTDYLLGKFSPRREYNGDATEKNVRSTILRMRRERSLTKDEARKEFDRLSEHEFDSETGFAFWYKDNDLGDAWEFAVYRANPEATAFAENVWPEFVRRLREEMAAEPRVESTPDVADLQRRLDIAEKQAAVFVALQDREIPCGHTVADLIGGNGADGKRLVTKCGACLAERQK